MKTKEKNPSEIVDGVQMEIWEVKMEIQSYSALLKSLSEKEIKGEDFQGLGITLGK